MILILIYIFKTNYDSESLKTSKKCGLITASGLVNHEQDKIVIFLTNDPKVIVAKTPIYNGLTL